MNLRPKAAAAFALAAPLPAFALFGVGDIVFDPANVAQTINVLQSTEQMFDRLGSILGVSTEQFDELVSLAAAIGNAAEAASYAQSLSPQQLQSLVQAVPGLANANLNALFNTNSQLDAFMGVPLSEWTQAVRNPDGFYRNALVNPAIERIGGAEGMSQPAIAYAQWYAASAPEDQHNAEAAAAADISNLLAGAWLDGSEQRRVNFQALAAAGQNAQAKAGQAATVTDQQHAQAQLSAQTNQILIESAVQATGAREATVRALGAQGEALRDQGESGRNAAEMRLDASP